MDKKVRFAVLGCGRISEAHLPAIVNAPNAELAAVCDIDEEKAMAAARKYGLNKWYTSFEAMAASEDFEVVNICTPSGLHSMNAVEVAKAGKHILCEKPLDVTVERMEQMISACREAGVKLGGIFQRRMSKAAISTRDVIRSGKLGKIVIGSAYLKYFRSQEYYDSGDWRGTWELDGGGALMNQGIHGIDLLQWMAGDIESVWARCATLARKIDVEDTAVAAVTFKSGAIGVIEGATSVFPGQDTIFSVHGDKGTISFGDKGFYEWSVPGEGNEAPDAGDGLGGLNCGWTSTNTGHILQVQDMAEAVLYDREPMVTGEEASRAVKLVLAIYESSRTGKQVHIK